MRCGKCGSENCYVIEETESHEKGFGAGKGCCGYILFGPIGILCGLCGMGDKSVSRKAFWICPNCGSKFRA